MADTSTSDLHRNHPLENQLFATGNVLIKPGHALARISLRAAGDQIEEINQVLSLDLPDSPKTSVARDERTALWLGPDEWLILDNLSSDLHELPKNLAQMLCSAVDISHRNTSIIVSGKGAVGVLNTGCPQNLSMEAFPVGACSRTILGKSEIILLRIGTSTFHVECWRSFSDYVWKYLVDGAKTL
ncbi:MAG: sarcosine oxidase subunit gamma family protein [Hyphomicrobiales bacterium]|nr:sarcosine oxidase subunit gamma family protein [Hyphomicrobiales bacterium]